MPTVTLPDWWALVMPCGCTDGLRRAVLGGEIITATAQEAWEKFTRLKRDRDREARDGWVCRAATPEDVESFTSGSCPHVTPASPDAKKREPQPGDGPDYHAEHAAWRNRRSPNEGNGS